MYEHADQNFHNEQVVEDELSFYMHCESQGLNLVFLNELIQNDTLIGETNISNLILPHESSNENHVYDRDKQFC